MKKILAVFVLLALSMGVLYAGDVEEAQTVPAGLSDADYQRLLADKQALDATRNTLVADISAFNSDCGKVANSDTAKMQSCTQQNDLINARIDSYKRDLIRFQESILRAQSRASVNLGFMKPEPKPLSKEERSELKDAPADIRVKLNRYHEEIRVHAKANSAWGLGLFLTEQGDYDQALRYFKEAREGIPEGTPERSILEQVIADPKQLSSRPIEGHPIYQNRADALLSALEYGKGNWDASYTYLQVAHKANPDNLAVRDALNYFEALYASEKGKKEPVTLGQIKPIKVKK